MRSVQCYDMYEITTVKRKRERDWLATGASDVSHWLTIGTGDAFLLATIASAVLIG